jgi:hypothetical protein
MEKRKRLLNKKNKTTRTKKVKLPTSIVSIDKLYSYTKYPPLQKPNDINKKSKTTEVAIKTEEIYGIYDQVAFDQWYKRTVHQQSVQQEKRQHNHKEKNFYSALEHFNSISIDNRDIKQPRRYKDNQKDNGTRSSESDYKKQTDQTDTYQRTKMPRLERKQEVLVPKIQTIKASVSQEENTETNQDKKKWEIVNSKETKRNTTALKDKSSKTYLPTNLPPVKNTSNTTVQTTRYVIPLSITVTAKRNKRSWIKDSRIMVAVLQAMQNVYSDTYISSIQEDINTPTIFKTEDIPLEGHQIRQYLVTPVSQKLNRFHGKLFMLTNHTIKEYKMNREFLEYLRDEDIILEMNDLDDINPSQVGFLEHTIPTYETLEMHTKRLAKILPEVHPKFQLHINTLYAQTGLKARVIMIKSDDAHVDQLRLMLEDLHKKERIKFFPMNEYQSCKPGQKLTIVKRINKWSGGVRNLLIKGFIDHEDDIPMVYNKIEGSDDPMTEIGVSEFLATRVKAGDGSNLFDHVYPPSDGIREVLFQLHQYAQAESYIKVAHGEMSRNMDIDAMKLVFKEPEKAMEQAMLQPVWTAHVRATAIQEMEMKPRGKFQPKRLREEVSEVTIEDNLSTAPTIWTTPPQSIFTSPESSTNVTTSGTGGNNNTPVQPLQDPVKELEAYKKLNDERMIELKQLIYSNARTANLNTESMVNMNARLDILSETVVHVDDRTEKMEKKMDKSDANTNEKFNELMKALGTLTGQMEKNNQTVAHLASRPETNSSHYPTPTNQITNEYSMNQLIDIEQPAPRFGKTDDNNMTIDLNVTMMSEHINKTYNGIDESYISSISREDYQSGNDMNRANEE